MSTINSILFGEIAGNTTQGIVAADVGYTMLEQWAQYTDAAGIHEFTSPTYTYVQLSALYTGYIHASRPRGREIIKRALDLMWASIAANWCVVQPQQAMFLMATLPRTPSLPLARTHVVVPTRLHPHGYAHNTPTVLLPTCSDPITHTPLTSHCNIPQGTHRSQPCQARTLETTIRC
jgi:hypothetical protein